MKTCSNILQQGPRIGTPILGSVYSPVRRLVIGMVEVVDSYIRNQKLKQWDFGYC